MWCFNIVNQFQEGEEDQEDNEQYSPIYVKNKYLLIHYFDFCQLVVIASQPNTFLSKLNKNDQFN